MKPVTRYSKKSLNILGIVVIAQTAVVPASMALEGETCADALHAASPTRPTAAKSSSDCPDYGQCIALGQQFLKDGNPRQAIEAFNRALAAAGDDTAQQSNAYGCLGIGYEANADRAEAQANLEQARAISNRQLAWVEAEYKRLLSSQKIMTAADIERKLNADKKIQTAEPPPQPSQPAQTPEEPTQVAAAAGNDEPTANMTETRGFKADLASLEDADKYKPKPLAQVTRPRPVAAAPRPKAKKYGRRAAQSPEASESPGVASLDLRINFEFRSADLTAEGKTQADELGKALEKLLQDGRQQAVLVGHTDIFGSEDFNRHLSEERAAAVKNYLTKTFPDLIGKLSERGMGMGQPLYWEKDEESQKLNRRVEVKLIPLAE